MPTLENATQLETLKILYRETCYNVQRCKADHGKGEAYSRACALTDIAWSALIDQAKQCNELEETTRFINATYDNR